MKKIYTLLIIALMLPPAGWAQSPANRLPKTVVADVLAQMPTQNEEDYNQMMRDLIASGSEGLAWLMDEIKPEAQNNNSAAGFAIGGLSYYVTAMGREEARETVQKALIDALERADERDSKAFFMRQLEIVGNDRAVAALTKYALTPDLSQEALLALTQIGSSGAVKAIADIFVRIPDRAVAAQAAGRIGLDAHDALLISWLGSSDMNVQRSVLFALSQRIGSPKVMKALEKAAQEVSFAYEPTQAAHSYLTALEHNYERKTISKLMGHPNLNIRTAAFELFIAHEQKGAFSAVLKLMDDSERTLRNAALFAIAPYADRGFNQSLVAKLQSSGDAAVDIVNYLGNQQDRDAADFLIPYLDAEDFELSRAAAIALGKMADLTGPLLAALPQMGDKAKISIIELLAAKRCQEAFPALLAQTSASEEVADAACKALADVASANDFDTLCTKLEMGTHTPDLQRAVGASLSTMSIERAVALMGPKLSNKAYYPVLGYIQDPKTFELLKQGLEQNDPDALATARSWSGFEAAAWLMDNFVQTGSEESLASYIRMINLQEFTDEHRYTLINEALEAANTDQTKNTLLQALSRINTYHSLLKIGQYLYMPETAQMAATGVYNLIQRDLEHNYWGAEVKALLEQFMDVRQGSDAEYEKTAIRKYINDAPVAENSFFEVSPEELAEGFRALFDGLSMDQWTGNTKDYVAENGTITLYPGHGGGGNLYTKEEFSDFILRFEFLLTPGANNGIGVRAPLEGDAAYVGTEIQVLDDSAPIYSNLAPYQYHGSAYGVIPAKRGYLNPVGAWNYEEIAVKGNHFKVTLNGTVILDGDLDEASKNGTIDGQEHPGIHNRRGHLGFLGHGSVVKFRNIRVKEW
ncbi:MAG: DUF1080 domain-containing protein [Bacteroidetes bacterium]|nr:DUF1080 domain-containing protein [Bacteroidota bacterium]